MNKYSGSKICNTCRQGLRLWYLATCVVAGSAIFQGKCTHVMHAFRDKQQCNKKCVKYHFARNNHMSLRQKPQTKIVWHGGCSNTEYRRPEQVGVCAHLVLKRVDQARHLLCTAANQFHKFWMLNQGGQPRNKSCTCATESSGHVQCTIIIFAKSEQSQRSA